MGILNAIPNWIRTNWSPKVSRLYSGLRLADRANLAANVKLLAPADKAVEKQLIENLALAGVIKYRFHQTAELSKLGEQMFSGRVTPEMITSFSATLANENFSADQIRDSLLVGVYRSTDPLMPKLAGKATSIAFSLGAVGAAVTGMTLFGVGFTSVVSTTVSLILAAKGLQKLSWFNPNSTLGKLNRYSSKLFYPLVFAAVLFGALAAYQFIRHNFYPRYQNEKQITVTCQEDEVEARVCRPDGTACRESTLWAFTGPEADQRCRSSAANLQAEINDNDLFNGPQAVDHDVQRLRAINPWRPSWTPEWISWGTSTLLDLTPQNLTVQERQDAFGRFTGNLWAAGIMPSGKEINAREAAKLETWLHANRFRDPRLQMQLDLASRYQSLDRYDDAVRTAQQIVDFNLTATAARPMFYDEALFLQADTRRIQAMRSWSPLFLDQSLEILQRGLNNPRLHRLENGYRARYNYEYIKSCVIGQQFFPREEGLHRAFCLPGYVDKYAESATFGNNLYTPMFADNFLAVRTFLEHGRFDFARRDYDAAAEQYRNALALVDLIDDCRAATDGDSEANWGRYADYMRPADRWIGEHGSRPAGLWSFARRCEIARALRWDNPLLDYIDDIPVLSSIIPERNSQLDPAFFQVFRARANQGLAHVELQQASLDPERLTAHLNEAERLLQEALEITRSIQRRDPFKFFTAMFEEREVHFEVLVDYSETLLKFSQLGARRDPADLTRAAALAEEVASLRGEDPQDNLYLRALFVLAEVDLLNNRSDAAASRYRQIAQQIDLAASQLPAGQEIPPNYQKLRIIVGNRLATLR